MNQNQIQEEKNSSEERNHWYCWLGIHTGFLWGFLHSKNQLCAFLFENTSGEQTLTYSLKIVAVVLFMKKGAVELPLWSRLRLEILFHIIHRGHISRRPQHLSS